jgi:hypothetical protein
MLVPPRAPHREHIAERQQQTSSVPWKEQAQGGVKHGVPQVRQEPQVKHEPQVARRYPLKMEIEGHTQSPFENMHNAAQVRQFRSNTLRATV